MKSNDGIGPWQSWQKIFRDYEVQKEEIAELVVDPKGAEVGGVDRFADYSHAQDKEAMHYILTCPATCWAAAVRKLDMTLIIVRYMWD